MKNAGITTIIILLALTISCKNRTADHGHSHPSTVEDSLLHAHPDNEDQDAEHNHDGEDLDAEHNHDGEDLDAEHNHDGEDQAVHEHEQEEVTGIVANFEYKSILLTKQHFNFVKKTSGRILLDNKGEISIIASSAGIVRFKDSFLYPGTRLKEGSTLFTIEGGNLTDNNVSLNFARVEADYKKAKEDFDRASELINEKLITREHYLEKKNIFDKAEAEYKIYKSSSPGGKSRVISPRTGFIKEILVNEGDKIESGDRLAVIQTEDHLVLRADIPPSEFEIIERIESAKFTTGYSEEIFNTGEMNGEKISYGRSTGNSSFYIPMYFKIDFNSELIPGTYADIWLIGEDFEDAIIIPNSSILEEYGKFYVYVDHGNHFDKRYIVPGMDDGDHTMVLSGLSENETVVTDGAYQVKLSMITSIPDAHNHNH